MHSLLAMPRIPMKMMLAVAAGAQVSTAVQAASIAAPRPFWMRAQMPSSWTSRTGRCLGSSVHFAEKLLCVIDGVQGNAGLRSMAMCPPTQVHDFDFAGAG